MTKARLLYAKGTVCCDLVAKEEENLFNDAGSIVEFLRSESDPVTDTMHPIEELNGMVPLSDEVTQFMNTLLGDMMLVQTQDPRTKVQMPIRITYEEREGGFYLETLEYEEKLVSELVRPDGLWRNGRRTSFYKGRFLESVFHRRTEKQKRRGPKIMCLSRPLGWNNKYTISSYQLRLFFDSVPVADFRRRTVPWPAVVTRISYGTSVFIIVCIMAAILSHFVTTLVRSNPQYERF